MYVQITYSKLKTNPLISLLPATVSCAKNAWKSAPMQPLTSKLKKAQYADINMNKQMLKGHTDKEHVEIKWITYINGITGY
jgi:hypothetical protein